MKNPVHWKDDLSMIFGIQTNREMDRKALEKNPQKRLISLVLSWSAKSVTSWLNI